MISMNWFNNIFARWWAFVCDKVNGEWEWIVACDEDSYSPC
jgi:hypothetical protein